MAVDERTRTAGLASGTGTAELEENHRELHENRDPLTGEGGAHPVGTGVGAASGGTVGAVVGGAVAGPVGALIGAAVGGLAGGLAGKGVAEAVNPSEEEAFWRSAYNDRPYAKDRSYEDLHPAYQYGWESRGRYQDRIFDQAESDLRSGWEQSRGSSTLAWDDARHASRDAWDRVSQRYQASGAGSGEGRTLGLGNAGQIAGGSVGTTHAEYASPGTGVSPGGVPRFSAGDVGSAAGGAVGSTLGNAATHGTGGNPDTSGYGRTDLGSATSGSGSHQNTGISGAWESPVGAGTSRTGSTEPFSGGGAGNLGSNLGGTGMTTNTAGTGSRFDTGEESFWRQSFASRPYASGRSYDDFRPAYQYGYDAASRYRGRRFEDVEPELSRGWDQASTGGASLAWANVKHAVRDAWDRVERAMPGDADRDGR